MDTQPLIKTWFSVCSLIAQSVKHLPAMQETPVQFLDWEDPTPVFLGFPYGSAGKDSACTAGDLGSILVGKIPWRRKRLPTPVFWPGELHGLYSPWGRKESDATFTVKVIIIIFVTFEFSDFIWICVLVAHSAECFFKIFY